jgi:hypothetical protein
MLRMRDVSSSPGTRRSRPIGGEHSVAQRSQVDPAGEDGGRELAGR